jgi:dihydroorotase/N-acyl-D-amino-acid deacylase
MSFTLLGGGRIIDGSGAPSFDGDLLLEDDRVVSAGKTPRPDGAQLIDCAGKTVAPGFIDLHSHSDLQVLENRREKLHQGVTTEVVGNCGFSPYPSGAKPEALREFANGIFRGGDGWRFGSAREYLTAVDRQSSLLGVQSLVGHGSLRVALFGNRQDRLTAKELAAMEAALNDALVGGACGLSTGLMYAPGSSAPFEELVALCKIVARHGKMYATHMRSYSFDLLPSVEEQLRLARESGAKLQISHLQAVGKKNWDKQRQALDLIETARKEGIDVEFDIYPYQAGSTVLTQLLPQWTLDGGVEKLLERLKSDRNRIAEETVKGMAGTWADVFISSVDSAENQKLVGKNFAEIGGSDPTGAAIDLLIAEKGAVNIVSFNQSVENLRQLLTHPLCSVISDGFYVKGRPHPRLYGTFPFLLGEVVRERKWMTAETAVMKITSKPAARLKLRGRGMLKPGMAADVTVFDAARIAGPATYESPEQPPVGLTAVFRNGRQLL